MKSIKILVLLLSILMAKGLSASTYYVNPKAGNDKNSGLTKEEPFKSLNKINRVNLKPGDSVLLAGGMIHYGSLELVDVYGTLEKPVVISSYLSRESYNNKATIDAKDYANGVLLKNCSNVKVNNLIIEANGGFGANSKKRTMKCGVFITSSKPGKFDNIHVSNLLVRDIFQENPGFTRGEKESHTANGTESYGWGIRVITKTKGAIYNNLVIESCTVSNVGHTGIKLTSSKSIRNLKLLNNTVLEAGGPGLQMSGVVNGLVKGNNVNYSGSKSDSRKWGRGSGLWTWGCSKVLIEHNSFRNANGPADSAGCHIDFNCDNVIVQYNISENNMGGFCEILGNNYNCAYRYNVSINDGYRVKQKGIAFQEGKTFWLSGFNGKDRKRKGPYNSYFYNNTIFVNDAIQAKIAIGNTSEGVLIANNIFYLKGGSITARGDQYKPEDATKAVVEDFIFKNNLFLDGNCWPKDAPIQEENALYGDVNFKNINGVSTTDFIPQNKELIKDKGMKIPLIPGDDKGLYIGLNPEYDILGNKIIGLPDVGAIEVN